MNPLIRIKTTPPLLITLALLCIGLLPKAQAVSPPPDGCYPNLTTAEGCGVLNALTTGQGNTGLGWRSLFLDSTGSFNTGVGGGALALNNGDSNTAVGAVALLQNTMGSNNTAIGEGAGLNQTTGSNNVYIGSGVGVFVAGESNAIHIADNLPSGSSSCYIGGIFGTGIAPPTSSVFIDSSGALGIGVSARRFKQDIKPMDKASEAILALKPVTFHYKSDAKNTPCFGLIAEDVAAVNPDLIVRDKKGEVLSVRYDQVNAMLLNEFLKEHCHVQKQDAMIAQQQKQIAALTAGLEKVSAQLATGRIRRGGPAPQVVNNP